MDSNFTDKGFIANEKTQKFIEGFVYSEFSSNTVTKPNYVANVNTNLLGNVLATYVNSKIGMLNTYIDSLLEVTKQDAEKLNSNKNAANHMYHEILSKVGKEVILSVCLHHFLIIFTHQYTDNENDQYTNLLAFSIKAGKSLVQKYLFALNSDKGKPRSSYSSFLAS